jgi:hypothetical protein
MLWFAKSKPAAVESVTAPPVSAKSPKPIVNHRDMVTLTLKKVLRTYGVPPHWVDCEVQAVETPAGVAQIRLVLTMNHWNPQLLRYTLTLQQNLLHLLALNLAQFEPVKFHVHWAFAPVCISPTLEVPAAGSWLQRPPADETVADLLDRRKTPRAPRATSDSIKRPMGAETRVHLNGNQDGSGFDKTAIAPFPFP